MVVALVLLNANLLLVTGNDCAGSVIENYHFLNHLPFRCFAWFSDATVQVQFEDVLRVVPTFDSATGQLDTNAIFVIYQTCIVSLLRLL